VDAGAPVSLPAAIRDAIVAAARDAAPLEMCGIVVGSAPSAEGGRPLRWVATRNAAASPYLYEVDAEDLLRVSMEVDARDEAIWAIVHSHPASEARPSPTDIRGAFYPEALHLLASLAPGEADPATGAPSVRAWRIADGDATEVALHVVG
jgi:[CysO sulfur-carrier protein]-S-L-cysteine hydrolase